MQESISLLACTLPGNRLKRMQEVGIERSEYFFGLRLLIMWHSYYSTINMRLWSQRAL